LWTLVVVVLSAPVMLAGSMAVALIASGLLQGVPLRKLAQVAETPETIGFVMLANAFVFATLALLPAWRSPEPLPQRLNLGRGLLDRERGPLLALVASALAFCVSTSATNAVVGLVGGELSGNLVKLNALMRDATGGTLLVLGVAIVLAAPLAEELFFRGYLQTRLIARLGPALGIVVTSALFALAHFDVVHSSATFFMGLAFGYVAYRARSLYFSVIAHVANNALAFLATRGGVANGTSSVPEYVAWALGYGVCAMLLAVCFQRLTRPRVAAQHLAFTAALAKE
jgi:membrane protease YdiL (CAAX protease family)